MTRSTLSESLHAMLPKLAGLAGRLPALPASLVLAVAVNRLAWRVLGDLDWATLEGKRFCVRIKDSGLRAYFSVGPRGLVPQVIEVADVTFTASADDFLRLALRREDPDTLFFNRRLLIEGDTNLGLNLKNRLDSVDLEPLLGRMPAPARRALEHFAA